MSKNENGRVARCNRVAADLRRYEAGHYGRATDEAESALGHAQRLDRIAEQAEARSREDS